MKSNDPIDMAVVEYEAWFVGNIPNRSYFNQPNVSNHLRCLSDCGLVVSEREGRYIRYALSDPSVAHFIGLAEELLAGVARGIHACTRYNEAEDG